MTEPQTAETEQQRFTPGVPIWTDVSAPDAAAAREFYTRLFGWEVVVTKGDQYGEYGMFFQAGKQVSGVGPAMDVQHPAAWSTYFLTENAQETATKVVAAGGQVVVPPMVVGPNGAMAIFVDPTGAHFGVWQPGTHCGAELFHVPVSVAWNELQSPNIAAASSFYAEIFGWATETSPFGDSEYTMWKRDDRGVAGGMPLGITMPSKSSAFWLIFFSVPNCDAMVTKARELGATVMAEPTTSDDGRYCVLQDPQGAIFGVISAPRSV